MDFRLWTRSPFASPAEIGSGFGSRRFCICVFRYKWLTNGCVCFEIVHFYLVGHAWLGTPKTTHTEKLYETGTFGSNFKDPL